ncbi:MAG: amidohydrolase family protein [Pseudonocardiales bacterium]|nr:amidohydrolase family protein [Pseudonocardiales bacterium]
MVDWRDRHRGTTTAVPMVLASGPPITSPGGHCWNMGGQARGADELRRAVQHRVERGVDIVKIMASGGVSTPGTNAFAPQFTVEELRAVVQETHAAGLRVTAHAHPLAAIRDALAAGVDAIEARHVRHRNRDRSGGHRGRVAGRILGPGLSHAGWHTRCGPYGCSAGVHAQGRDDR